MFVQNNQNLIETIDKFSYVNHNIYRKFVVVYIFLPMLSFPLLYHTHQYHKYIIYCNFSNDNIYKFRMNKLKHKKFWTHRAKTSALNREPMRLPKWGTLFTYGKALVIKIFRTSAFGFLINKKIRFEDGEYLLHLFIGF